MFRSFPRKRESRAILLRALGPRFRGDERVGLNVHDRNML
jgi:hypothetical protein